MARRVGPAPRALAAFGALSLWLGLAAPRLARADDTLTKVRARGELLWAADIQGGEPYVFEDPERPGVLVGFEVDLAAELARRMGVRWRVQQYAWSNIVPGLERGDFDVGLNGLEATSERQDRLLLSRPYFIYAETLAVRRGATFRTLADLEGKRVGTLNQTYAMDLLRAAGIEPRYYEGVEEPYLDLEAGHLDAVLMDNIIADRYGCPRAGIECLPGEVARGAYVILMRRGDGALQAEIDRHLEAMAHDGSLERILRTWKLWDARQSEPLPALARVERERRFTWAQFVLFVRGAGTTLELSLLAFLIAVPLGFGLALLRLYGGLVGRLVAGIYVEAFRGTPVLLQLYLIYFAIGAFDAMSAAILGLGLNYAAYEAEIYRGAILSVPRGQTEAAHALGLSGSKTMRYVVAPQALRVALPPMTNDFIALLKDSSIVGVISVVELTKRMSIAAVDLRSWVLPGIACAALYFGLSFPLSLFARWLERRLARGQGHGGGAGPDHFATGPDHDHHH
jgi:polar amino acid transport system substrate-binding protein